MKKCFQRSEKILIATRLTGNVYFADMSFSIVRPKCFDNMKNNLLPQKWMGKKILPFENDYGLDIDFKWQMPQAEYWINKYVKRK